jgi:type II secretory pathway pseudopilin PulG
LRRLRADPLEQEQESEGELGGFEQIVNDGTNGLPDAVQTAIQIGAIVLVIAIVLLLLALTMRRVRSQPEADTASEERESLWSRDLAMSQLRNLFKRGDQDALDRIDLRRTPPTVRDAYRALQALAAREGTPRLEAETPSAFGSRLARAWPEQAAAIMELTRRYERVRYGETPDDAERATALQAWSTIVAARNRD